MYKEVSLTVYQIEFLKNLMRLFISKTDFQILLKNKSLGFGIPEEHFKYIESEIFEIFERLNSGH
jgi:hypothetical protein